MISFYETQYELYMFVFVSHGCTPCPA